MPGAKLRVEKGVDELQPNCEVKKIYAYYKAKIAIYDLVLTPAVAMKGGVFITGRITSYDEFKCILNVNANFEDVEQNDLEGE